MLGYIEDIVKGAFTSGVNLPTFWFLNGCLFLLTLLCLVVALTTTTESSSELNLPLHFSAMAALALGLGITLNYVIREAKVLGSEKKNEGEAKQD